MCTNSEYREPWTISHFSPRTMSTSRIRRSSQPSSFAAEVAIGSRIQVQDHIALFLPKLPQALVSSDMPFPRNHNQLLSDPLREIFQHRMLIHQTLQPVHDSRRLLDLLIHFHLPQSAITLLDLCNQAESIFSSDHRTPTTQVSPDLSSNRMIHNKVILRPLHDASQLRDKGPKGNDRLNHLIADDDLSRSHPHNHLLISCKVDLDLLVVIDPFSSSARPECMCRT